MKTMITMVAMVIGMTSATAQIKGTEGYLPTDDLELITGGGGIKIMDVNDEMHWYFFDKSVWAGAPYERVTKNELTLILNEAERILKENGMTLEDYNRVVVGHENVVTKHLELNIEKLYKEYLKNRWVSLSYIFEIGTSTMIFSLEEKEVRLVFGSDEAWKNIQN